MKDDKGERVTCKHENWRPRVRPGSFSGTRVCEDCGAEQNWKIEYAPHLAEKNRTVYSKWRNPTSKRTEP